MHLFHLMRYKIRLYKKQGMTSSTTYDDHLPDSLSDLLILQQDLAAALSHHRLPFYPSSLEADTLRDQNDHLKKQLSSLSVQVERFALMAHRENEGFPCPPLKRPFMNCSGFLFRSLLVAGGVFCWNGPAGVRVF
jgi:hypothetical protein